MEKRDVKIRPIKNLTDDEPIKQEGQLSLDIFQTDTELIILAPIAGIERNDLELAINEDVLVIKGARINPHNPKDYLTHECFWGPFSRSILLPREANTKKVSATFEKNILEVHIEKEETDGPKIIKIQES